MAELRALDKIDIAALRKAEDVCFFHREDRSYIRAIKRAPQATTANPFLTEQVREIDCGTDWHDFEGSDGISREPPYFDGFAMVNNSRYADIWPTLSTLLKPGDTLTLSWRRGAWNSEVVRQAGLHGDVLYLQIHRGKHTLTFFVDHSMGPDNTARMIRNVRPKKATND